ncbi:pra1 family protein b2, partial [Quercus suber]
LSPLLAYLSLSSLPRLYDQPLVILGRTFFDCEIGLLLLTVIVIFPTTVGSFLISMLMLGLAIMCAHDAFRVQEDLFLDDQELANSVVLSFLGSIAFSTTTRVKPSGSNA